jgi:hypothetical protein
MLFAPGKVGQFLRAISPCSCVSHRWAVHWIWCLSKLYSFLLLPSSLADLIILCICFVWTVCCSAHLLLLNELSVWRGQFLMFRQGHWRPFESAIDN